MFNDLEPHLLELRSRLIRIFILFFIFFGVAFFYWKEIFHIISLPLIEALPKNSEIIFTSLTEPFFTATKIAFYIALIFTTPYILWNIWGFIKPALYENEKQLFKKLSIPFIFSIFLMFIIGALFAYFFVFPVGFKVLINFGGDEFKALPRVSDYVEFVFKLILGFGLAFEMPVFSYFLAKIGLITEKTLIHYFRYVVVIIFIVSAILTPPDVFSQFALAIPLLILYGLSILIAKLVTKSLI